jgi:hypothetical protein
MAAYEDRAPQGDPATERPAEVDTAEVSRAQRYVTGLGRRRAAAYRVPVLESGCSDPWRYDPLPLTDCQLDGWQAAMVHLRGHGLTAIVPLAVWRALRERGAA